MPAVKEPSRTHRDCLLVIALTAVCAALNTGYWFLFHDRTHYEDFQELFPIILWFVLILVHAVLGIAALGVAFSSTSATIRLIVSTYFGLALIIHTMVLADYTGWNERLYTWLADLSSPQDAGFHQLLDEQAAKTEFNHEQLKRMLEEGANADSWRGTWAIWKVWGHQNPDLLRLLLDHGAKPDRPSRSGTSHLTFDYQVDGWVEKWVMLRDQSTTLLCDHFENNYHDQFPDDKNTPLLILDALLQAGADPNQMCRRRHRLNTTVMGLAIARFNAPALSRLLDHGGQLNSTDERTDAREQLRRAAAYNQPAMFAQLQRLLPLSANRTDYSLALTWAIEQGESKMALYLLDLGTEPAAQSLNLTMEKANADQALLTALVNAGTNPNLADNNGRTPLDKALQSKRLDSLKTLISLGANPTTSGSLYGLLVESYRLPVDVRHAFIGALLAGGANLERRGEGGRTFLLEAVYRNDLPSVQMALRHGANPKATDAQGRSVTDIAQQRRVSVALMQVLGATPPSPASRIYELTSAAASGHMDRIIGLIAEQVPINHRDINGRTPLEAAMRAKQKQVYQFLLQNGADPNTLINNGSALDAVSQPYSIQRLRQLRGLGKEHNAAIPILAAAAMAGQTELVAALIAAGADADAVSPHGESVLHLYTLSPRSPGNIVPLLLAAGAPADSYDANGFSPLTLAASKGAIEFIDALVKAGIAVNTPDRNGRTAFAEILRYGSDPRQIRQMVQLGAVITDVDIEFVQTNASPRTVSLLQELRSNQR